MVFNIQGFGKGIMLSNESDVSNEIVTACIIRDLILTFKASVILKEEE